MNKVLIIDDDKELCALMKKCIEQENMSALIAYGGTEGLELVSEHDSAYSLIILDVMMPDIDGFQVLQKIRETSNVPVLMLTAKSDEEDKVAGLRMGADDYLTKPFDGSCQFAHTPVYHLKSHFYNRYKQPDTKKYGD